MNRPSSVISAGRLPPLRASSDQPSPFVDIELHQALVAHFQQQRMASFLVQDIGAFHDFIYLERFLAERTQDIFPVIQHDMLLRSPSRAKSLGIRKLIFRNYPLNVVRFASDAVSKTSIRLNGHTLNDGVNHWRINGSTALRPLRLVVNVFIQVIGI
jgi:hypothetical protein